MGEYKFIEDKGKYQYQLVYDRKILWATKYDVYLDNNAFGKLEILASYNGDSIRSQFKSHSEAARLFSILKASGIKKEKLLEAKLPKDTSAKINKEWSAIVNWLAASMR